jgi:hypothetical protein
MRPAVRNSLAALAALTAAAGPAHPDRRVPAAPALLSRTGLYGPAGSGQLAPRVLAYSPQYPLWSDGAGKARWMLLPKGTAIDGRDPDAWVFPVGTRFWKEFSFAGRKVETRLLWRATAAAWVYAAYAWRADQTDADLVGADGLKGAAEIAPGVFHAIPSRADCQSCHESPAPSVLGFNALQLSTDRDPGAIHGEPLRPDMATLATLVERRLIRPARREWLDRPPRIRAANPRTRSILGYLASNCGGCHQPDNPIPNVTLVFRHPPASAGESPAPAILSALGRPTHSQLPGARSGTLAIAPGQPDASLVAFRMGSRAPLTRMPPVGSVLVDQEALEQLRAWIAEDLGPGGEGSAAGR